MAEVSGAMNRVLDRPGEEEATGDGKAESEGYFSQYHKVTQITFVTLAWIFAIASLILCAVWGSRNGIQYLNIPSWDKNVFAWHPLLLICGFFFSQVFVRFGWFYY